MCLNFMAVLDDNIKRKVTLVCQLILLCPGNVIAMHTWVSNTTSLYLPDPKRSAYIWRVVVGMLTVSTQTPSTADSGTDIDVIGTSPAKRAMQCFMADCWVILYLGTGLSYRDCANVLAQVTEIVGARSGMFKTRVDLFKCGGQTPESGY